MIDVDWERIAEFIKSVGAPMALLLGAVFACYRVGKPLAERLVAGHLTFMDRVAAAVEGGKAAHEEHTEKLEQVDGKVTKIAHKLDVPI